jgi:hypothetical protein
MVEQKLRNASVNFDGEPRSCEDQLQIVSAEPKTNTRSRSVQFQLSCRELKPGRESQTGPGSGVGCGKGVVGFSFYWWFVLVLRAPAFPIRSSPQMNPNPNPDRKPITPSISQAILGQPFDQYRA